MKKKQKLTKKQLSACHLFIFERLSEIAMNHYREAMELNPSKAVTEKNGKIHIDLKKMRKRK